MTSLTLGLQLKMEGGGGNFMWGLILLNKVFMQPEFNISGIRIGCKMHNVDKCACTKAF